MNRTSDRPAVTVGLLDGPVALEQPDLMTDHIRRIASSASSTCTQSTGPACVHGLFVAGILSARRGPAALAICSDCTLLPRLVELPGSTKADPYGWVPAVIGNGNMPGYRRGRPWSTPWSTPVEGLSQ